MSRLRLFPLLIFLCYFAHADSVMPYENVGHAAPDLALIATSTGNIQATYTGGDAAGQDYIRLVDLTTGTINSFTADNYKAALGETFYLGGFVTKGDKLRLDLLNDGFSGENYTQVGLLTSIGEYSADLISHVYGQNFSDGTVNALFFAGENTYVGFEDLPLGNSDLDYNDTTFVLSNVSATATPEPSSLLLLGSGLAAVGRILKRRRAHAADL